MESEVKDNGIINHGGLNIDEEKMKEYLLRSYLNGKSLTVTHQVFVLEQRFNALVEAVSKFSITEEERIILNEFRL